MLYLRTFKRLLRYGVGSVPGVLCYLAFFHILTGRGVSTINATIVGFFPNFAVGFVMLRFVALTDSSGKTLGEQIAEYFVVSLGYVILNPVLLQFCKEYFHLNPVVAQSLVVVVLAALNCITILMWVFPTKK